MRKQAAFSPALSGAWRRHVNAQLDTHYQPLFARIDELVFLKGPAFEVVYEWRAEQERKLRERIEREGGDASRLMEDSALRTFIAHYERLTRHILDEMPSRADVVIELDAERRPAVPASSPLGADRPAIHGRFGRGTDCRSKVCRIASSAMRRRCSSSMIARALACCCSRSAALVQTVLGKCEPVGVTCLQVTSSPLAIRLRCGTCACEHAASATERQIDETQVFTAAPRRHEPAAMPQ